MEPLKKQVKILVSNIGGGKTTLSKRYVEFGYVVISRDTLRYGIGNGEYIFNPYCFLWSCRRLQPFFWSLKILQV